MQPKTHLDLKLIISNLLVEKSSVSLHDVAQASGLSKSNETDRKAIRRVIKMMIAEGLLEAKGAARARIYVSTVVPKKNNVLLPTKRTDFQNIKLSPAAKELLKAVSKSLSGRTPVGYNQNFIKSYTPNKSFYLSQANRQLLAKIGKLDPSEKPAGTYARHIASRLLIDLSWNSSRLEGNTYSLLETKRLIEFGESADGKNTLDAQMILNHKNAIEYIIENSDSKKITSLEICSIHALLSENLLGDSAASGRLREINVGISGTTYVPLSNPHVLKDIFKIFINKLNQIIDPFEHSFFSLVHLSYLQAFEDVNKRTARIVANIPLVKANFVPMSFTDIEQNTYIKALLGIYETNDISLLQDLYLWSYARSVSKYSAFQQSMEEPNILKLKFRPLIAEIIKSLVENKVPGSKLVEKIKAMMKLAQVPKEKNQELFQLIETEIMSLHEGNIARYKIRPSQFLTWKKLM